MTDAILDLWATHSSGEIAAKLGVTVNAVFLAVRGARVVSDPRAVRKTDWQFRPNPGWWRAGDPEHVERARRGGRAGRGASKRRRAACRDAVRLQIDRC